MSRTVACVLVLDGWAAAAPTLASIRRLGLDSAVGVIGEAHGPRPDGVEVHLLEWRDDFADARNQLADKLSADWLLWLNDDEVEAIRKAAYEQKLSESFFIREAIRAYFKLD